MSTSSEHHREAVVVARRPPPPTDRITWEPSDRWVRATKANTTVVDSRRSRLVWEPGRPVPLYAFPEADVHVELLRPATRPPTGRHPGAAAYYDLTVGGDTARNAAWSFPEGDLAGYVAFEWFVRSALDHWYEEETEVFVHPRDPYQRVDALPSSRHVRVEIDKTTVADTRTPVLLFETNLPVRYYIPPEDVRFDLLIATGHSSRCPYKGVASQYWSWKRGGPTPPNVAWSYPDPLPAVRDITGKVAFYNEFVDTIVDGEPLERPVTYFSGAPEAEKPPAAP
ncbi:DUF427 domain-containing protein [Streptomyces sp. NPDC000229]|uniref:DUF427 domain-containing protein n=1 Tax=Streptomyces sp. NPDC000229 TaxID=3154247 RepID=UPI00331DA1EE